MTKKPNIGRQKIKIAKIEIKNHLHVTFSKRRLGLFKKASELCILCGVEIAVIVFSPAGKAFSFGHPNVESIIHRFLSRNPTMNYSITNHFVQSHRNASVLELNLQLNQILNELEAEKTRAETLDRMRKASQSLHWWEAPIEDLGSVELEQLRDSMEELKKEVSNIQSGKNDVVNASNVVLPFLDGNSVFDQFECKPSHMNISSTTPHDYRFGLNHGFF